MHRAQISVPTAFGVTCKTVVSLGYFPTAEAAAAAKEAARRFFVDTAAAHGITLRITLDEDMVVSPQLARDMRGVVTQRLPLLRSKWHADDGPGAGAGAGADTDADADADTRPFIGVARDPLSAGFVAHLPTVAHGVVPLGIYRTRLEAAAAVNAGAVRLAELGVRVPAVINAGVPTCPIVSGRARRLAVTGLAAARRAATA
jgi:hypothetical protein